MPITAETFRFMTELWKNNNKRWFDKNRERYVQHVRGPMKQLAQDLIIPMHTILPDFTGKPKISKINADIRFHPKKKPYKKHVWISFYEDSPVPAELFVYIGGEGWGAGMGCGAGKMTDLDYWRSNLTDNARIWRKYSRAAGFGKTIMVYNENQYKKPLRSNIPEDLYELVQAKSMWMVDKEIKRKTKPTDLDFFVELCRVLPAYMFVVSSPMTFMATMKRLAQSTAPDKITQKIWKTLG